MDLVSKIRVSRYLINHFADQTFVREKLSNRRIEWPCQYVRENVWVFFFIAPSFVFLFNKQVSHQRDVGESNVFALFLIKLRMLDDRMTKWNVSRLKRNGIENWFSCKRIVWFSYKKKICKCFLFSGWEAIYRIDH